MSLLDPAMMRAKEFATVFRGYDPREVSAYLGRIALVIEVVAETGTLEHVPATFTVEGLRARTFARIWRGYDVDEVRAYLDAVASEAEAALVAFGRVQQDRGPLPYVPHRPVTNPVLTVGDLGRAASFYERLGFSVDRYDDGYAWVKHCSWEWFHLAAADPDRAGGAGAYLHVADVDAWHAAMTTDDAAATAVGDIAVQPWGKREFSITDPWGNVVRVGADAE